MKSASITHDGHRYGLYLEAEGWRLKSRARGREVSHRTGTTQLQIAKERAREFLRRRAADQKMPCPKVFSCYP